MKNGIVIIGIVLMMGLVSCTSYEQNTVLSSLMIDTTDTLTALPDIEKITQGYGFENNLWNTAGIFRLRTIGSITITNVEEHRIDALPSLTNNKFTRIAEVNAFFGQIDEEIEQVIGTPNTADNSSIYATIVDEIAYIQKQSATKKELIIFSNLMENDSSFLSYYHRDTKQKILQDPQQIRVQYEATYPLVDMDGIDVWIVHDPGKDYEQAKLYQQIAMMYKDIFIANGASSINIVLHH